MFNIANRSGIMAAAGLAVWALAGPRAHAQNLQYFQLRPGLTVQQYAYNVATIGRAMQYVPPYALGYNPYRRWGYGSTALLANAYVPSALVANAYAGNAYAPYAYNPYLTSYSDPYGGYLYGGADVIDAQGRFLVSQQQAYLMREQYRQAKIDTRRKTFDEYLYEREQTPTPEERRQRYFQQQVLRSRNNPPLTEIWSGKALNDLLADLRLRQGRGDLSAASAWELPLDEQGFKSINVTSRPGGNLGLLKNEGRLNWPVALSGLEFQHERERVNGLIRDAVRQATTGGRVDAGTLLQLADDVDRLDKELIRTGRDLPFAPYSEAKTFLGLLDDALRGLRQPDVGNYFTGRYEIRARTVAELVRFMADHGLQFAAAVPGDEAAYNALHHVLAGYDVALVGGP